MKPRVQPTSEEITFLPEEIIVSKTDLRGRITYANSTFSKICGYSRAELMNAPHSIIRHPDMPRCVFKLLWDQLGEEREIFAYVKNMARNGAFYWVFAHITPSFDNNGTVVGYHSSRRTPDNRVVKEVIEPLYGALLETEASHSSPKDGLAASFAQLMNVVKSKAVSYDELVFSL